MAERPIYPDEEDILDARRELHDLDLSVAYVGRVQRYDAALQVADIVPMVRQQVPRADGRYDVESLPIIPSVPICFLRVGPWFIAASVEPGDSVLCIVLDGDHAPWWGSQATQGMTGLDRAIRGVASPGDLRRHHVAHTIAIPMGMEHRHNPLRHAPEVAQTPSQSMLTIGSDLDAGTRLTIFGNGRLRVTQDNGTAIEVEPNGTVHLAGAPSATKLLALAELVDDRLATLREAFDSHEHPLTAVPVVSGMTPVGTATGSTGAPVDPVSILASVTATKTRGV